MVNSEEQDEGEYKAEQSFHLIYSKLQIFFTKHMPIFHYKSYFKMEVIYTLPPEET